MKFFPRLGEFVSLLGETQNYFMDLEKCLEGLVKLVLTSYRLGEMPGGFGETGQ